MIMCHPVLKRKVFNLMGVRACCWSNVCETITLMFEPAHGKVEAGYEYEWDKSYEICSFFISIETTVVILEVVF